MSVALLITPRQGGPKDSHIVPIATQDGFKTNWKPAAETLGLRWVPSFEVGVTVERDDLPEVIGELDTLRAWCISSGSPGELIVERVNRLVDELNRLKNSGEDVDIFIG